MLKSAENNFVFPARTREECIISFIWAVLLTNVYLGDQIKNEMGRACGTYGGQETCIQRLSGETPGKGTTWKTYV